jgi:hypothetical protein
VHISLYNAGCTAFQRHCVHQLHNRLSLSSPSNHLKLITFKKTQLIYNSRNFIILFLNFIIWCIGLGSSVEISTGYVLDGPVIESMYGEFLANFQTGSGAHPSSCTMDTGSFPGVKRPGSGADLPHLLAPMSKMSGAIPPLPFWAIRGLL